MFDLGDDIILDNFKIPWLFWVQILIMFLLTLTILFSYFGFLAIDSSSNDNAFSTVSPSLDVPSSCSARTQVAGDHGSRRDTATTTNNRARCSESNIERNDASMKDVAPSHIAGSLFHPCWFFYFAKEAFLKCLGLGSQHSPDKDNEHQD